MRGESEFLGNAGELATLIRSFPWSTTPVGPIGQWPQSLKTITGFLMQSPIPIVLLWGPDGVMIFNDAYSVFAGRHYAEKLGKKVLEAWPEVADFNANVMKVGLAGGTLAYRDQELTLYRSGRAEQVWMNLDYSPVLDESGRPAGVIAIVVETTDRVLADRLATAATERQRQLLNQMPGFVAAMGGPEHVFEYVNEAYVEISQRRDFLGRSIREVFPDLAGQGFYELLDGVYATGTPVVTHAMELRLHGSNEVKYIDFVYEPIRDAQGVVTGVFAGGYDVTELKRASLRRDALIRLTDRIRYFDDTTDIAYAAAQILGETLGASRVGYGTIDADADTLIVAQDWSAPGVETLAGVTALRDYGSFIDSLKKGEFVSIADVERDGRTAIAADALAARSARAFVNVPVLEQGRLVAVLYVNNAHVRDWSVEDLSLIREIAERTRTAVERIRGQTALRDSEARLREANETLEQRVEQRTQELARTEEALRQAQKMEAVGQLTGGIAHDFNNLLQGIGGSLELMERRLAEGRLAGIERYIGAAQGAARRAAALTQRLLAFARRQTLDPRPTDVNKLISGMEDLIRRTVGPNVEVEVVGAGGLWASRIDASQLESALLNLSINARDAMAPAGGRLTIETANKWLDERAARERELTPGQYVSVCVTDTGAGMTPQVMARAFDPFFTTKPLGEGTGLGLSMVYGFARQSGGQVRIYSEVGKGTTMCLYLPRFMGVADSAEPVVAHAVAPGAGETVLVIDDEATIRMLVVEVLKENGYAAIEAFDGASGLRILQSDARIDLLITDVGLPGGMNGRQVADAARVDRPGLKVLFITGFAENAAIGNGHLSPGMEVVTKPFELSALGHKIRDLIDR
ncbi:hypothetical protein BH11PSE3_BH11PSE3_24440 [soil metagenome]